MCVAFVALTSNNAKLSTADSAYDNGFAVNGAYIQIEEGTSNDSSIAVTFVAGVTENYYNAITQGGKEEVKLGMLVGPTSKLSAVTNYATAIAQGYNAIFVGSENAGGQQIMFTDGFAELEAGVVYNEATLSTQLGAGKTLIDATSIELTAIPFVVSLNDVEVSTDDEATCYLQSAITRCPRAMIHELYVRSANFDYVNNADAKNVPTKISKDIVKKFAVDVEDSTKYTDKTGSTEYYISKDAGCLYASASDNKLNRTDLFVSANGYASGDKVYVGGVEYNVQQTSLQDSIIPNASMAEGEEYSYSIAIFKSNGTVVNYTVKVATRVIVRYNSSNSTETYDGLVQKMYGDDGKVYQFNSIFANNILSATDRTITETYDGYYVLGDDVILDTNRGIYNDVIYNKGNRFMADGGVYKLNNDGTKGFTGTFDGRGFSILEGARSGSNLHENNSATNSITYQGTGIFVWINGGTVKNLSIFNATTCLQPRYCSILAHAITGNSLIENVYIRALPFSFDGDYLGSVSRERGAIIAGYAKDSTFRNVVVESDFMDAKDGYVDGSNHLSVFEGYYDGENTYENVFVLGDTPPSYGNDKTKYTVTFWVGELPKINETDYAVDKTEYALKDYPTLKAAYGDMAVYMLNKSRGPQQDKYQDATADDVKITFDLKYPGVKQFSGYRDLAAYVNNSDNVAIKNALVSSGFFNVADSGFVTPKHIPQARIARNNTYDYTSVDDMIVLTIAQRVNKSNPINRFAGSNAIMVMADENGKFYADFTPWADYVTGTRRLVVYNKTANLTKDSNGNALTDAVINAAVAAQPTFLDATTIKTATHVEITPSYTLKDGSVVAGDTLYQLLYS